MTPEVAEFDAILREMNEAPKDPRVAEFDAILRELNGESLQPVIEGECRHVAH